jgi:hypothetical protein
MTNPEKAAAQLKHWQLNLIYGMKLALLAYLLSGAIGGEILLFGRGGKAVVRGWAAWMVCLIPLFLSAYFFVLHDPRFGSPSKRRPVAYSLLFLTIATAITAGLWSPQ